MIKWIKRKGAKRNEIINNNIYMVGVDYMSMYKPIGMYNVYSSRVCCGVSISETPGKFK